jgi:hypothetical protein
VLGTLGLLSCSTEEAPRDPYRYYVSPIAELARSDGRRVGAPLCRLADELLPESWSAHSRRTETEDGPVDTMTLPPIPGSVAAFSEVAFWLSITCEIEGPTRVGMVELSDALLRDLVAELERKLQVAGFTTGRTEDPDAPTPGLPLDLAQTATALYLKLNPTRTPLRSIP